MSETMGEKCRLEGGPEHLPSSSGPRRMAYEDYQVKVQFHNGWEHFERIGEFTDKGVPIFQWIMRTKVAE